MNDIKTDRAMTVNKLTVNKKIGKTGKYSLIVKITDEAHIMGLDEGDEIEITIKKIKKQ